MSYLLAFAGFAALIILHEFGHFAAAKAVGMRVERFALFFPPLVARLRRGETEYALGTIPLGGYVKITGMNPNEAIPPEVAHRAYYRQAVWKRVVVIAAGPFMNFVIAFGIIWALIVANGLVHSALRVDQVEPRGAAVGQLRPGDRILSVDGRPGYAPNLSDEEIASRQQALRAAVNRHRCSDGRRAEGCTAVTPATVVVRRGEERITLRIRPRYNGEADSMLLGFRYGIDTEEVAPGRAAGLAVETMWQVTTATVTGIVRVFYDTQARREVSGVVGGYEATRQSFDFDTTRALYILALISLSLAVVNLFPFLPLDGGHIFWAVAEKLRGRPIPFSVMERASVVGFMLVAILFAIGLTNDIGRLTGEGFNVR
ncbi:MAG TPA: RIP metalloprotease [Solirubrobacteraceae bacterium]|nr:RIP metalloprotease [Solirubrobacteraceae bacterium]